MKMTMGLKKGDIMTEAMEGFWGKSSKMETPQEVNVIGMSQDAPNPQEAYDDYQDEGKSIKERVEANIDATRDLTPDPRAAARYSGSMQGKPQGNPFDLGGLDAMNQRQLARERGSGLGIGFGAPAEKLSFEEKANRIVIGEKLKAIKANTTMSVLERKLALQQTRADLNASLQQQRSMAESRAQINRSFREDTTRSRYNAGLPVYESPLDVIAGGKRQVRALNEKTGKYEFTGEIERYGGLFGAAKEGYGFYRKAQPVLSKSADLTGKALKDITIGGIEKGKKASAFINKSNKQFASDAKGVFEVAKTQAGKSFKSAKVNVDSYFDNSDIGKTMDSLLEKRPGNTFVDQMYKEAKDQRTTIPIHGEKRKPFANIEYSGRDLNPDIVESKPFDFSNQMHTPRAEPARVVAKQEPKYNDKMINDVMSQMNNEKPTSAKGAVKDLRDII